MRRPRFFGKFRTFVTVRTKHIKHNSDGTNRQKPRIFIV